MTAPFVDVEQFGAVGDGQTDDTGAFDAAAQHVLDQAPRVYGQGSVRTGTVYVPPGRYLVSGITSPPRVSWRGEPRHSVIAGTGRGAIIRYPEPDATGGPDLQWPDRRAGRPMLRDLALDGVDRGRVGLQLTRSRYGVDLRDVRIYNCSTGILTSGTHYGMWANIALCWNDFAIVVDQEPGLNSANVRVFEADIQANGTAVLIRANASRTAFIGGTIQANGRGVLIDYGTVDHWLVAQAPTFEHVWFEDNRHDNYAVLSPIVMSNGWDAPMGDVVVVRGALRLINVGASHVWGYAGGKIVAREGFLGRGPLDAFFRVEEGFDLLAENTLLPALAPLEPD